MRNIIWFNLLFSKTVSTKIAHYFLNLLNNHYQKIINFTVFSSETVKVSYSSKTSKASLLTTIKQSVIKVKN